MRTRTAELTYSGDLRFETRTGTGRGIVFGDRPEALELSPVETVMAALAACSGMDVASILEKRRRRPESYTIRVEAQQRHDYPQVFTRLDVVHEVSGPRVSEADVRRCVQLSAEKYCPVNAMISAGATEIHHRYRVHNTGPRPFEAEGEVVVTGPYRRPDPVAPAVAEGPRQRAQR